jgi:hypothetical protein
MKGTSWRNARNPDDAYLYVLQVDEVKGIREENRISKYLKDWHLYGDGYDPSTKTKSLIFRKSFVSEAEWKNWARSFPYLLEEITEKTGRIKPYKLGLEYQKKKGIVK